MKKNLPASFINLLYHEVSQEILTSGFQNKDNIPYTHSPEQFVEMMTEMKNKNQLSATAIENFDFNIPQQNCLITFDDGGKSALLSSEILENLGAIGHYFVTTQFINKPGFLSEKNLNSLIEKKHHIGSHSHTHPMIFRTLSYPKMKEEWSVSKKILEDITGKEILSCSVPGGDADQKTYESAIECGYKFIFNSEPDSKIFQIGDAYILGRFSIKNNTSLLTFNDILSGKNHQMLQNKRKLKNTVKKLIFPLHQYLQNKKNT